MAEDSEPVDSESMTLTSQPQPPATTRIDHSDRRQITFPIFPLFGHHGIDDFFADFFPHAMSCFLLHVIEYGEHTQSMQDLFRVSPLGH